MPNEQEFVSIKKDHYHRLLENFETLVHSVALQQQVINNLQRDFDDMIAYGMKTNKGSENDG